MSHVNVIVIVWRPITCFNAILEDSNLPLRIDLWPSTDLKSSEVVIILVELMTFMLFYTFVGGLGGQNSCLGFSLSCNA